MQNPYHSPPPVGMPASAPLDGIGQRTASVMQRTKGWVRFISVALFVFTGLMTIPVVISFAEGDIAFVGLGFAYLAMTIFGMLIPAIKLTCYANRIGTVLQTGLASDLERALNEHRGFWKFVGIMQIIGLVFMLIGFVASFA